MILNANINEVLDDGGNIVHADLDPQQIVPSIENRTVNVFIDRKIRPKTFTSEQSGVQGLSRVDPLLA